MRYCYFRTKSITTDPSSFNEGQVNGQGDQDKTLTGTTPLDWLEGFIHASDNPLSSSSIRPDIDTDQQIPVPKKRKASREIHCQLPECPRVFYSKKAFGDHMSMVHTIKAFSCDHCPAKYSRSDALKTHKCKPSSNSQGSKHPSPVSSASSTSTSSAPSPQPPTKRLKGATPARVSIKDLPPSKVQPLRAAKRARGYSSHLLQENMAPVRRSSRLDGPAPLSIVAGGGSSFATAIDNLAGRYKGTIERLRKDIEERDKRYEVLEDQKREVEKKNREAEKRYQELEDKLLDLEMQIARANSQYQ